MVELKGLAWNGVPDELRPIVWQLLLVGLKRSDPYPFLRQTDGILGSRQDYLPSTSASRHTVLSLKRQAYLDLVNTAFKGGTEGLDQAVRRERLPFAPLTRY